ncbi:MAG: SpoIID/LytB domain-containing protein [Clostridiales bacterium]|nr:SpoIID/LytB domain-containing protein [Clostridiales bacterium]
MRKNKAVFFILILIIIVFLTNTAHGTPEIPERIRVGLNYNSPSDDIIIDTNSKVSVIFFDSEQKSTSFIIPNSVKLSFRTDDYYNIKNGETKKIQYIKAVKYEGKLIGPYHIQIGESYLDYDSAQKSLNNIKSSFPDSYLAYDGQWRVWSGLFLDEKECIEHINNYKKKFNNFTFSLVGPDSKRVQIVNTFDDSIFMIYKSQETEIKVLDDTDVESLLEFNNTKYRGNLLIRIQEDNRLSVINDVRLSHYLYSVVGSEVSPSWHMEALKAQAVASRNYTIVSLGKHKKEGYHLCSSTHCQAYKGYTKEHERTNKAVDETGNQLLYYKDKLANTFYHSSSGGHTENSENIWSEAIPYIRGVEDPFSNGSPHDTWLLELNRSEIKKTLEENNIDIGQIVDIRIIETSQFGRAVKVEFVGTKNKVVLEKERVRYLFGTSNLKSIWYEIKTNSDLCIYNLDNNSIVTKRPNQLSIVSASGHEKIDLTREQISVKGLFQIKPYNVLPDKYFFHGRGWGHGLGMSQYGAKGMAERGHSYKEILEYYYKGTKVK